MPWRPILDGALAEAARATVRAIADDLAAWEPEPGYAGDAALFWAYAAAILGDDATTARYDAATERLIARLQAGVPAPSLYGGVAGAGFALAHISDDVDEFLGGIDDTLVEMLRPDDWPGDYDLIQGLVGLAVYFLERLRSPSGEAAARAGLARIVEHLDALAVERPPGVAWWTRRERLPELQRRQVPDGNFNCGLAHGVPGVIAVLGRIATSPAATPRARALCEGAIRWQWAQALPPSPNGQFPSHQADGRAPERARTAWCYGDPGVAIAILGASARLGLPTAPALELGRASATRDPAMTAVRDAALCHGAAGLGHLFNRMFQTSGDPVLRDGARAWFERALAMARPGHGVGGYLAYRPAGQPELALGDVLEGAAGIGLALIAAVHPEEPGWDRILLADAPLAPEPRP